MKLICYLALLAPLAAQSPTPAERERAVAELRASRKLFLDAVTGLSPAQWNFKAGPDRWSVAECAEHIALAEDGYFDLVTKLVKSPADPAKKEETKGKDDWVLQVMVDRTTKRTAPESLQPTRRWQTAQQVAAHFEASRDRLIRYVETTQDQLRTHFQAHRAVGLIDTYQWILLASGHSVRHTMQINAVKADRNFPRASR